MSTTTYLINGMTCGHCVSAVTEAIGEVEGVTRVDVDLDKGQATVTSEGELDHDAVQTAVAEAGYELAS